MGKQVILLGLTGSFDHALVAEIVQLITAKNLQVQHASNRYDGNLHIYTGTPDDIKATLADCGASCVGIQMSDIPQAPPTTPWPGAVDLPEGPLAELLELTRGNGGVLETLLTEFRQVTEGAPKVRVPKAIAHLEPHQQRVVMEKTALDELVVKLDTFITGSPIFAGLDEAERERLVRQHSCMVEYSGILAERIAVFPVTPQPKKRKGAADAGGNAPLNQAGAGGDTGGTHESGTAGAGTGGTAPAGAPVGADGKPPEAGDVPTGAAGGEEKTAGTEDGAQKEGGSDQQQTTTES